MKQMTAGFLSLFQVNLWQPALFLIWLIDMERAFVDPKVSVSRKLEISLAFFTPFCIKQYPKIQNHLVF